MIPHKYFSISSLLFPHFMSQYFWTISCILLRIQTFTCTVYFFGSNCGIITILYWYGIILITGCSCLKYKFCVLYVFEFANFLSEFDFFCTMSLPLDHKSTSCILLNFPLLSLRGNLSMLSSWILYHLIWGIIPPYCLYCLLLCRCLLIVGSWCSHHTSWIGVFIIYWYLSISDYQVLVWRFCYCCCLFGTVNSW